MQAVNLFFLLERASFYVNNKNKDHSDLLTLSNKGVASNTTRLLET